MNQKKISGVQQIPPGFKLRNQLRGHKKDINQLAWSPDGRTLASGSYDNTIRLWSTDTGELSQVLTERLGLGLNVAWSPSGQLLASGSIYWRNQAIQVWDTKTPQLLQQLKGHSDWVRSIAWSPDGQSLASGAEDKTVLIWDVKTWQLRQRLEGHSGAVYSVAWSPDGQFLVSSSNDGIIRLWNHKTWQHERTLEGHAGAVFSLSFTSDRRLLASKSMDGTIRFWRCDTWVTVAILDAPATNRMARLAFHPKAPILAAFTMRDEAINLWNLNLEIILGTTSTTDSVHYTNAKVVLLGDTGVGKSGLSLVLTGQKFAPTESTHGRHVWTFDNQEVEISIGYKESRETLLWDMAGQPGYRLIHQLHLNEVAVALVIFDARSETDPFAGLFYWDRAIRQAQLIQGTFARPLKKFLVAARMDREGIGVGRARIDSLINQLGFNGYFETSAKDGRNIIELTKAIREAIDWDILPKVSSTTLFQNIKAFLVTEKKSGRQLSTIEDLYRTFMKSDATLGDTEQLRAQFEICIRQVESQDLIKQLSFGNLVLLQPELLDAYASALIMAAKEEPDGLGNIEEKDVREGAFPMLESERLKDKEQEKLLLIAMIEDLLRRELILREEAYLVFPSQSTRERSDLNEPEGKAVIYAFEGPVMNIYATLIVRLSHSSLFSKKDLWKNAVTYTAKVGGIYGLFLNNIGEGQAELTLFFDKAAGDETCFHFEEYVKMHLQRRALPSTIQRRRIFICSKCDTPINDLQVTRRRKYGSDWIRCNVCDTIISLRDGEERLVTTPASRIAEMDRSADSQRDYEAAQSSLQGKIVTKDYDVFLCYNDRDRPRVREIGEKLKEVGILPWLDEWELRPGLPWQRLLEEQIEQIKSAAVFVGKDGIGPWQRQELDAFLREFVERGCPVIPVLLEDAPQQPVLPIFLKGMSWVNFRIQDSDPLERLIWGITGKRGWAASTRTLK